MEMVYTTSLIAISILLVYYIILVLKLRKEISALKKTSDIHTTEIKSMAIHSRELTIAHNELVNAITNDVTQQSETNQKNKLYEITWYFGPKADA